MVILTQLLYKRTRSPMLLIQGFAIQCNTRIIMLCDNIYNNHHHNNNDDASALAFISMAGALMLMSYYVRYKWHTSTYFKMIYENYKNNLINSQT